MYLQECSDIHDPLLTAFLFLFFNYISQENKILSPEYCIQGSQKHDPILQCCFSPHLFPFTLWISNLPGSSHFYNKVIYFSVLFPYYSLSPKHPSPGYKILAVFLSPTMSQENSSFRRCHLPLHYCSCRHLLNLWKKEKKKGTFRRAYFKNNLPSFIFFKPLYILMSPSSSIWQEMNQPTNIDQETCLLLIRDIITCKNVHFGQYLFLTKNTQLCFLLLNSICPVCYNVISCTHV